jgi:uncharacterized membrane protein
MRLPFLRADTVTGEVVIARPVHDVYAFYCDFANLPRFLGDVVAVQAVGNDAYRWTVSGPFGIRVPLTVVITEQRVDRLIRYRTCGPALLRAHWQIEFAAGPDARWTRLRERLVTPLGGVGRAVLSLIGKYPDREVAANLTALKTLLESAATDETQPAVRAVAPVHPDAAATAGDRPRRTP